MYHPKHGLRGGVGAGGGAAGQELRRDRWRAGQLEAAAALLLWCLLEGLHKHSGRPAGHASAEAWAASEVASRSGHGWSYVGHLLEAASPGAEAAYPPRSLVEAVRAFVLLAGAATAVGGAEEGGGGGGGGGDAGRRLFLYYLLDLGVEEALQDRFAAQFGLSLEDVGEVRGAWLLDGVGSEGELSREAAEQLEAGCDLLCTVAGPRMPRGLGAQALQMGRPERALYMAAVREHRILGEVGVLALADAELGMEVRLACGRLHEASLAAQAHLETLPSGSPEREHAAEVLTRRLCDWSLGARALHGLVELPLLPEEERAFEAVCGEWASRGEANSVQWVLYLLLRDRVVEASAAFSALEAALGSKMAAAGGSGMDVAGPEADRALERCREMLRIAEGQLPEVQRSLLIREAPAHPGPPAGRAPPLVRVVPADQDPAVAGGGGPRLRVARPASGAPAPFSAPALR